MTELERYTPREIAETSKTEAVQRLATWAQSAQAAYEVATRLSQTSFVPEAFRGAPADATAAILAGSEVGLSPMASLRAFDIIQGTAAPRALTLRAVAQANGCDIEVVEATETRCKVRCRRRGGAWQEVVWTIDRAKRLNLTGKKNWRDQPQAMLIARATAEAARIVAADAILGLNGGYAIEEIDNGADEPTVTMSRDKPRTVRRAQPAPEPEPELEPTEPEPETGDGVTSNQLKKIGAAMRDRGLTERADALAYVAGVIGRDIASRNELTKAEAHKVIDALEADTVQEAEPAADEMAEPGFDDNPGFGDQQALA
jgi:hypothetical protein